MSWQTYVDEHLLCDIEGNHLSSAAILGHDGSVWAQSSTFPQFKPEEITAIMNDFAEPGSLPRAFNFGDTKYKVIQGEPGAVIRGRKKRNYLLHFICPFQGCVLQGRGGVIIRRTNRALIIGIYDQPMTLDQGNTILERLGNHLINHGF